jgi:ATP-dependent helicase/nuclease subunit B
MSSSRYGFIARRLKQTLARTAAALAEHARRGRFAPVGLEIAFGPGGKLPPLVLPAGSGRSVEVVGRIDRVDAAETEDGLLLRIIDYKSSAQALRLEDVVTGLTLQLLTYLDVLLTHAPDWLGRPADPAGVLYFHVHDPLIAAPAPLPADEARRQALRRYKTRGLLTADERVVRMMDLSLETGRSELVPAGLKKGGGFYSDSAVVTRDGWHVLRGAVRRTIERIGSRILDGEVAIAPYRQGDRTPCSFCPYKPVCHFDPLVEGNGYRRIGRIPKEQIWELLRENADAANAPAARAAEEVAAAGGPEAGGAAVSGMGPATRGNAPGDAGAGASGKTAGRNNGPAENGSIPDAGTAAGEAAASGGNRFDGSGGEG